jgi:hypothetical protein
MCGEKKFGYPQVAHGIHLVGYYSTPRVSERHGLGKPRPTAATAAPSNSTSTPSAPSNEMSLRVV